MVVRWLGWLNRTIGIVPDCETPPRRNTSQRSPSFPHPIRYLPQCSDAGTVSSLLVRVCLYSWPSIGASQQNYLGLVFLATMLSKARRWMVTSTKFRKSGLSESSRKRRWPSVVLLLYAIVFISSSAQYRPFHVADKRRSPRLPQSWEGAHPYGCIHMQRPEREI